MYPAMAELSEYVRMVIENHLSWSLLGQVVGGAAGVGGAGVIAWQAGRLVRRLARWSLRTTGRILAGSWRLAFPLPPAPPAPSELCCAVLEALADPAASVEGRDGKQRVLVCPRLRVEWAHQGRPERAISGAENVLEWLSLPEREKVMEAADCRWVELANAERQLEARALAEGIRGASATTESVASRGRALGAARLLQVEVPPYDCPDCRSA